jgi:hypothetical protein
MGQADGQCHPRESHGFPLPDSGCTPGAANPTITLEVLTNRDFKTGYVRKEARRLAVEHDQIIEDVRRSKVDRLADLPPPSASASRPPGGWTSTSNFSTDGLWKAAATSMRPITAAG